MKRFLHIALRFSLLPLLFVIAMETFISMRKESLLTEKKLEKLFADKGPAYGWIGQIRSDHKVLLLGSSTVRFGLNCDSLNRLAADSMAFINLGGDGRDPIETYFILQKIDLHYVKEVYYALDPWIFARSYYTERDPYFYLDLNTKQAIRFGFDRDPRVFPKRYKAFISSLLPPRDLAHPSQSLSIPPGFGSDILDRVPVNFSDPVHYRFKLEKYGWSDLQFEYLQKIAVLCRVKNIAFHLFYTPKRLDFIRDYEKNGAYIHASFLEKLNAFGINAPILGRLDQLKAYGDSIFADAYHLNRAGQALYAAVFWRMISVKAN